MGAYIKGTTDDLQIDAPGKLLDMLQQPGLENHLALVNQVNDHFNECVKKAIDVGGLMTATPERIAMEIANTVRTFADANPLGSSYGRLTSAIGEIDSQIEAANTFLKMSEAPPKPPTMAGHHELNPPYKTEALNRKNEEYSQASAELAGKKAAGLCLDSLFEPARPFELRRQKSKAPERDEDAGTGNAGAVSASSAGSGKRQLPIAGRRSTWPWAR